MVLATSLFVAAAATFASSALAHPHVGDHHNHSHLAKRAPIISQCNHDFSMTYDDGPYIHTSGIIDDIHNASGGEAKVTFYMNGKNWRCIYEPEMYNAVIKAYNAGHQIASHTWSHARLTDLSNAQIDVEIQRLDEAFVRILGIKPRFIRPPYGSITQAIADYIQTKHNKVVVTWDWDTEDTWGTVDTADEVVDRYETLLNAAEASGVCPYPPHLTLSHDVQTHTAAASYESVSLLHDGGYKLITTAQCLDQEPYIYVGQPQPWSSSWTCEGTWTPPPATPTCLRTYTSVAGDTCDSIGAKNGMTAAQVLAANSFLTCNDIWANTPICITTAGSSSSSSTTSSSSTASPGPSAPACLRTYSAVAGDTCASIGAKFGMTAAQVQAANTFVNCNDIWAWTPICITTAGTSSSSTSTSSSSSAPPSTPSQPTCLRTYKSKAGDTCASIASAHGMTTAQLQAANSFVNCSDIWVNTDFCITTAGTTTPPSSGTCVATYSSKAGENCAAIETKFGLSSGAIKAANSFVTCTDIWANTSLCIPTVTSACTRTINASGATTCAAVASANALDEAQVKAWNSFVTCSDIWAGTSLCVRH